MDTRTLTRLESDFRQLSLSEQLQVLERLTHVMREQTAAPLVGPDAWLAAMAADPEMQQELAHIAAAFAVTDADGLESV